MKNWIKLLQKDRYLRCQYRIEGSTITAISEIASGNPGVET
jgi:hypothetical protein